MTFVGLFFVLLALRGSAPQLPFLPLLKGKYVGGDGLRAVKESGFLLLSWP